LLFYYPNRPTLIPPDPLNPLNPRRDYMDGLERSGKYIAELKGNGDNCSLYTDTMTFMSRHKTVLKYHPTEEVREELSRLPKGCVVNLELMHNRTKTVKNRLMVHCLMVYKGEPLYGKTWGDSRKILEDFQYGNHLVLSQVWKTGFFDLWKGTDGDIIEGIILKDPKGKLVYSTSPINDVNWMMKIRKPSKKYSF
jgi:hypothetical protein